MFAREPLIHWTALWLVVSIKCTVVYLLAAAFALTIARHRPAWRSFLWIAALASFPCLALLEWTAGGHRVVESAVGRVAWSSLSLAAHAYTAFTLILLGLIVHSMIRLHLLRAYSGPLDVNLEASEKAGRDNRTPLPCLLLGTSLFTNGQLASPTSFGILRPAIILPEPPIGAVYRDFVRAALVHELIKTLRFDALWTLLSRLVQCFWFPHPVVWRAFRHYCSAREQVCDRWTVRTTGEVSEYELHLLALGRAARPPAVMSVDMPMDATGGRGLPARIRELQNYERPESLQAWPTVAATVLWMLLLAALAAVTLEPLGDGAALGLRTRAMLMGGAGAFAAGGVLVGLILLGKGRHARLTPPIDGLAGRSRQTLAECVQRLDREWRDLQAAIAGTFRRLEPLLLMLMVVAATVGFWFMASPKDAGESGGGSVAGADFDDWQ